MGIFMLPSSYTYLIYRLARLPLGTLSNRQNKALMCVYCNMFPVDAAICLICGMAVNRVLEQVGLKHVIAQLSTVSQLLELRSSVKVAPASAHFILPIFGGVLTSACN